MSADMKAAREYAELMRGHMPPQGENLVAAFLEVTAELERERKARIEIDARWQEQFVRAERAESTIIKDRVFMAAERKVREHEREVRHTVENTLTKIQRMSETGTAQNFLKLTDQEKARWFANAVIESSARKKWQERAESAEAALEAERKAREEVPKWTCFHCGFSTAEKKEAEAHFGDGDGEVALCVHWSALQKEDRLLEYQAMIRELNFARDELVAAEQRAAELQARLDRVEQVCNDESRAAWDKYKFGGPAEQGNTYWEGFSDGAEQVLAALSAQSKAAAQQEPAAPGKSGVGTATTAPAPSAAPSSDWPFKVLE